MKDKAAECVAISHKNKENHPPSVFWEENRKARESHESNCAAIDHKYIKYVGKNT